MYNNLDYEYTHLTGADTYQVASGNCILGSITLNTNGGTVGVIDNNTGTTVNFAAIATDAPEQTFIYNTVMKTGIRIVLGSTADITIAWKQL